MRNPPPLACAILLHTPPPGAAWRAHFDFLVEPPEPFPGADAGRLWTARMDLSPAEWAKAGTFPLVALPPHRRDYLTYEGPVSGGRGNVKRVDAGEAAAKFWTADAIELELRLGTFSGHLMLRRTEGEQWTGEARRKPE